MRRQLVDTYVFLPIDGAPPGQVSLHPGAPTRRTDGGCAVDPGGGLDDSLRVPAREVLL
jgi:hypothetical protein